MANPAADNPTITISPLKSSGNFIKLCSLGVADQSIHMRLKGSVGIFPILGTRNASTPMSPIFICTLGSCAATLSVSKARAGCSFP